MSGPSRLTGQGIGTALRLETGAEEWSTAA